MSMRYKGAVISATPPTLSPNAGGSGAWTLEQQMQANAAGLWPKNGPFNYIEDVFSTYLYAGNSTARTITNGIDLSGKGGLTWIKNRTNAGYPHMLYDTVRGATNSLSTNSTTAQLTYADSLTAFNSSGFSLGADTVSGNVNNTGENYASWTFREQPKFFDVVTYTGNGVAGRTVPHNLGSVPGCMIIKVTSTSDNWAVYHRSLGAAFHLRLNATSAATDSSTYWNNTNPTSTEFTLGTPSEVNTNGATYVAYLFAHNAGGFGLSGADNVISCGSVVTDGLGGATVNLGYEPQWVLWKRAGGVGNWHVIDTMRGMSQTGASFLYPNLSSAEDTAGGTPSPFTATATGFQTTGYWINDSLHIYIAIRRGPMAVPTTGTSVFAPAIGSNVSASGQTAFTAGFPVDLLIKDQRSSGLNRVVDRLRGGASSASGAVAPWLRTTSTAAESASEGTGFDSNTALPFYDVGDFTGFIGWMFRRAPGFFDEVCYTGTGGSNTLTHNLAAAPELVIIKSRSSALSWQVGSGFTASNFVYNTLESTDAGATFTYAAGVVFSGQPTASSVFLNSSGGSNGSGTTYVAYLFASCPGVSKVGSFTGTGATQVINCGFTGGARFVLIKSTSTTGNWLVWDSARGIVAGNDPYLALNSTAAEVTNTDWVDTAATGFELSNAGGNLANSNGVSYIFWAVA